MDSEQVRQVPSNPNEINTTVTLHRVVGLSTGILIVAGNMIGSGAFKKIVPMSQILPSEGWILAVWIIAGVISILGALTYAGLARLTEESGGTYEYLRLCFGNFFSFHKGWTVFIVGGSGSIAALAFIFAQSVNTIIPLPDPLVSLSDVSIGHFIYPFASSGVKILAVATVIILTWVNYLGIRKGTTLNNFITIAKITGILLLIIGGLVYGFSGNRDPIASPVATNLTGGLLFSGIFGALLSALWAYDGWDNITYITGEIKNPKRNVPLSIIFGISIAMILYVLVNFSYTRVFSVGELSSLDMNQIAAAEVAGRILGNSGKFLVAILIMISTFGALNVIIILYPRLYFRMAQEGFFFKGVEKIHPVYRTPHIALIYSMAMSCIMVISGTFDLLTNLVIFSGYIFFIIIALGLIKMKRKGLITEKIIGYPYAPVIVILFASVLLINTFLVEPLQSLLGVSIVLSGLPFYFYFRRRKTLIQ